MPIATRLLTSIAVLLGLICFAAFLRHKGFRKSEHGGGAKLVTHGAPPALIFASLATTSVERDQAWLALIMLVALPVWQVRVLALEAAMPSALLAVALRRADGCDAAPASRMVFLTTALSALTIPLRFDLLT